MDGTWNRQDSSTNVLHHFNLVREGVVLDGFVQKRYYHSGVGTGVLDSVSGGGFGFGLEANVRDAYNWLIQNFCEYENGAKCDEIYVFGFSRGAYTARSIAGMIRRCGILRRDAVRQYPEARALYRSGILATDAAAVKFREANAIETETPIQCVGVWDTVGALGVPLGVFEALNEKKYQFLDTSLSHVVKFAFHALAVDEHRKPFLPTLWATEPAPGQTLRQVWFAGAHSDVGGGYPEQGLSDLALDWMMDSAKTAGLEVDDDVRRTLGTAPNYKQDVHISLKGPQVVLGAADRQVGATKFKSEYFHRSLVERWRDRPDYRPKPLQPHAARLDALAKGALDEAIYPVS